MKVLLCSLILICSLLIPLTKQYLSANHHNINFYIIQKEYKSSLDYTPIAPQKPQKKKEKKKRKENYKFQAHTTWGIILSIIGLILLPLGIGLELPVLWIIGTIILILLFILTIIAMIKSRQLANEGEDGIKRTNILLLSSIFLTLLGVSFIVSGIIGNILALWILGAILILPGIIWIITLSIRKHNL